MEIHVVAQMDNPALVVVRIDFVRGREARPDLRRFVGFRQIPEQQRVVEVVADEAVSFKTLVGVPGRDRNIPGGHRDA